MSVDSHGWIEVRPEWSEHWSGAVKIDALLSRDYDAFGCLFGIQNFANFRPLAAGRGLPSDVSEEVRQDAEKWRTGVGILPGATWVGWSELRTMDWEVYAERPDSRLHQYVRLPDGTLVDSGRKSDGVPTTADRPGSPGDVGTPEARSYPSGWQVEAQGIVYRAVALRRKDVLGPQWHFLFQLMETLSGRYRDPNVRLVAWFDT